jgi:hypothetical protein
MQWADISLTPSPRTLRQFAGIWTVFFAALSGWRALHYGNVDFAFALAGLAACVGPLGLWKPQAIRPIFVGCTIVSFPIREVVPRVLLAMLFYGVFAPVGLLFRLTGRDVLHRDHRPDQPSYWRPKATASDVRSYFRQF